MGFFDNVRNSLTETSQDLTQKAKDTTEIFRLNNLNKTKEKEIEKVIYQIGLSFYSTYADECQKVFPELSTQIRKLQEEIAENKKMIEKLSVEEICPECGKKLNQGAKFCMYCGTKIDAKAAVKYSGQVCSSCGNLLEEGAAFCTNCGEPVKEVEIEGIEPEEKTVEHVQKICKKCGEIIEEGDCFCMNCGEPVEK